MRKFLAVAALSMGIVTASAIAPRPSFAASAAPIEFDMMTWLEVKGALAAGKTTAIFHTGGVEMRGPQNVNGGHNFIARAVVKEVAQRLGNAIAMPVLSYTPDEAYVGLPGTIGLTKEMIEPILERLSEQAITLGFKNVVLMGDHGGGVQPDAYRKVAQKLEAKYGPKGIHVFYCDDVYLKTMKDVDKYLRDAGYGADSHGGLAETSTMLYLGGDKGWVRKELIPTAVGDEVPPGGGMIWHGEGKVNNGITGDARKSNVEIGKRVFEFKVENAVNQIRTFIKPAKTG